MTSLTRAAAVIDIVDDVLFLAVGVDAAMERRGQYGQITVRVAAPTWFQYLGLTDSPAPVVVVRDELDDHVPTVLKARALAEEGVRTIVVADGMTPVREARLREEGVVEIITADRDLAALIDVIEEQAAVPAQAIRAVRRGPASGVALSDRQLQVACLFAAASAPSTRLLSETLNLPRDSVRTHLQRARAALGVPGQSRDALRLRLKDQGWIP